MKPHFGQSDAAMNKLDLHKLPLPDVGACSCVPCKHYEVSLDHGPCVSCRDHAKFEEKDFDPVKERDAAYDLGFKDAQGYYGHHNGCDCAVCEDMHNTALRRKIVDAEWNKLMDDNKRLTSLLDAEQKNVVYAQQKWAEAEERVEKWKAFYDSAVEGCAKQVEELTDRMGRDVQFWKDETRRAIEAGDSSYVKAMKLYGSTVELVEKYRAALHIIAHMGISGLSWQHDYEKCVNIAKEALEI